MRSISVLVLDDAALLHKDSSGVTAALPPGASTAPPFQRAWGADEFPQMGVYDYAVGGDAGWSFVFYPVDEPSSQYGGWVGVGDIEAAPVQTGGAVGDIYVLDRDNQGGPDAAVKRVYKANVFHYDADRVLYKHLVADLLVPIAATAGYVPEKVEGIAVLADGRRFFNSDNDGVDDHSGESNLLAF